MKRLKWALTGGIALLLAMGVLFMIRQFDRWKPLAKSIPSVVSKADMGLKDVRFTEVKGGANQWEIRAREAQYFQEGNLALLEKVEATIFGRDGRRFSIKGDSARLDIASKDVEVKGNVVASSSDGYEIRTTSLKYSQTRHEVFTDDKIMVQSPRFKLEGKGMVFNIDSQKLRLLGGVKAVGTP